MVDMPFNYRAGTDITKMRIGYLKSVFDQDYSDNANDKAVLAKFREMGVKPVPIEMEIWRFTFSEPQDYPYS
ncbi:MAG: hypothetical protein R2727_06485 [Bacteroidales bacterium]